MGLNHRPTVYKTAALSTELRQQKLKVLAGATLLTGVLSPILCNRICPRGQRGAGMLRNCFARFAASCHRT